MRQNAARLNRVWLTVIGLVLLLAGLAGLLVGTGLLRPLARAAGLAVDGPSPTARPFGPAAATALGLTWVVALVGVVGVLLALLGLAWLIAQIPRANEAKTLRLQDTAAEGLTRCAPDVLTDAVEKQIEGLPGVQDASAVLRGTVQHPDLTVSVTATDRADIPALLHSLQTTVAGDVGEALDTRLQRLGVRVEIGTTKTRTDRIIL